MDDLTIAAERPAPSADSQPTWRQEPSDRDRYRAILERKIEAGARSAGQVIATIQNAPPRDQIVRMRAARFEVDAGGLDVLVGDDRRPTTDFALGQIAGRVGVPLAYLRELVAPQAPEWQHDLAGEILQNHYDNAGDGRILVRSVHGRIAGWLSDKYRRIDSRPLVDALAEEAQNLGAVPIDGVSTETRVALKLVMPRILEPIPGEFMALGGEWSNSDFGNGTHSFRTFAIRVVCLLC